MSVTYRVDVVHHDDGDVDVTVHDVGSSPEDREAVAYALEQAARKVREGDPLPLNRFN